MDITPNHEDAHDPYGAAIEGIHKSLAFGFANEGEMSDGEYEILKKIQEFILTQDPHIVG